MYVGLLCLKSWNMSWSGMYGRRGSRQIVAVIIGSCGVLTSTAMRSEVKFLYILCSMFVLMAGATSSLRSPVWLDWYVVYVCIFILVALSSP